MNILGICDSQDAGACMIVGNKIVAAVNEERLSRIKLHEGYYNGFPYGSIAYCLQKVPAEEVDAIAIAGLVEPPLPIRSFGLVGRMKETAPTTDIDVKKRGLGWSLKGYSYDFFCNRLSNSLTAKASTAAYTPLLKLMLKRFGLEDKKIYYVDHHLAHAAGAYFTSGRKECTVFTLDGHGDGLSGSFNIPKNGNVERVAGIPSRGSVGWFYSAITNFCGFKQHRHEGKITGLAAYGDATKTYPNFHKVVYYDEQNNQIINKLGPKFIGMKKLAKYIPQGTSHEDIAAGAQKVLEEVVTKYVDHSVRETGLGHVALSGGIFANVKLNQFIHELESVDSVFVHPHMGDGGLAVGAAYFMAAQLAHEHGEDLVPISLDNVYFGPGFSEGEIVAAIELAGIESENYKKPEKEVASILADGHVVARFGGRMEYGPRALGNRSILYNAGDQTVNDWLNKKLRRTEFMPFAPVTLDKYASESYNGMEGAEYTSKFMTITFDCDKNVKKECPAVVHVDNTARPQIITKEINESYFNILDEYRKLTGIPTIINTSFNMHGESIVCTPSEAIRSFQNGQLDYLSIGNYLIKNK